MHINIKTSTKIKMTESNYANLYKVLHSKFADEIPDKLIEIISSDLGNLGDFGIKQPHLLRLLDRIVDGRHFVF